MAKLLEVMDDAHEIYGRGDMITAWVDDLQEPTRSDEEIALEVNALEIDPDAKVVETTLAVAESYDPHQLPLEFELQTYFGLLYSPERVAAREKRAELALEAERWQKMKLRYDQIAAVSNLTLQNDTVPHVSELIVKKGVYVCLGGAIVTPGEFYVNSTQSWNPLEEMMAKMQAEYVLMDKSKFGVPWKGHLNIGFIVGARCHKGMEFHRARIVAVLGNDKYKVQFLDYGDIFVVPFSEIRYLPLKFLETMEFQAIRCTLQFGVDQPWTKEEGEYFRQLMFSKTLAIRFRKSYKVEGGTTWEVDVHFYNEERREITDFHVERQVFEKSGRNVAKREGGQDVTDPKTAISKFNFE